MHTIKFNGGIGNQLFQYAFYKFCQKSGIVVDADTSIYKRKNIHGGFLIDEMIPGNTLVETKSDIECYYGALNLYQKISNKLLHHVGKHYYEAFFKSCHDIIPFLKKAEGCYLEGWWQYKEIALPLVPEIRKETMKLEQVTDINMQKSLDRIRENQAVAVHIRRGDYLNASTLYGDICTIAYYKTAIEYVKKEVVHPAFFIFSDDIEYCRSVFKDHAVFISSSSADKAYIDILLMAECKHHIVANSSFSWWGTTLSRNEGLVIMPNRHNNILDGNPLALDHCILIDKNGLIVNK